VFAQQRPSPDVTGDRRPVPDDTHTPPDPAEERALIERACAGDRFAIGALYDLHNERIYRFILFRVNGNHSDAEDITAEVFIRMVEYLPRYEWKGVPFQAWLFRIAATQVVSHYRRPSNRASTPIEDMDVADPHAGPDALVDHRLTLKDVYEAAKKLPEAQRRVIELRFGSDLSVRETAQILNKSENNVKVLQHKALERLKKLLRNDNK
jgi:RNA polymerase sigma-70 factor (ECF subfamily)